MAFRQSALPPLSRRYSNPAQYQSEELASPARGRTSQYEAQLGPISDFGSLNTISKTEEGELSDIVEDVVDDLDSLDEGLQAFREPSLQRASEIHNASVLPTHDGLGSFHPARDPLSDHVLPNNQLATSFQAQFEPFSRFDDLRDKSLDEELLETSRHERIERWRLEQSKVLLEEIEKERQRAEARHRVLESKLITSQLQNDKKTPEAVASLEELGIESIWQKLARHVMKDFIGVNDTVLSAIFGEDLMPEELSKTPTLDTPLPQMSPADGSSLLNRLIKELRALAQGLSMDTLPSKEQLTGRFDYAGIPLSWFESSDRPSAPSHPAISVHFEPTLDSSLTPPKPILRPEITIPESEYWEQTPNLKTVISYLYHHFRSSSPSIKPLTSTTHSHVQDPLQRAAIIREHHPLTSRHYSHIRSRKQHNRQSSSSKTAPHFTTLKRPGSSCASWSTKRSRRAESSGSRNYWDLGESLGSGSMVFTGAGAWGEV